jgi:hypothetical protein
LSGRRGGFGGNSPTARRCLGPAPGISSQIGVASSIQFRQYGNATHNVEHAIGLALSCASKNVKDKCVHSSTRVDPHRRAARMRNSCEFRQRTTT